MTASVNPMLVNKYEPFNSFVGQPLTRQLSVSLNPSRNLEYAEFFRRNTNRENGWLEVCMGSGQPWIKRWVVFEDSILSYGSSPDEDAMLFQSVPMNRVVSVRTDNTCGQTSFLLTTTESKLRFRASSENERNRWLFAFQKSVALVLSHIMTNTKPVDLLTAALPTSKTSSPSKTVGKTAGVEDSSAGNNVWLQELGNGHGKHSFLLIKRRSSFGKGSSDKKDDDAAATGQEPAGDQQTSPVQSTPQPLSPAADPQTSAASDYQCYWDRPMHDRSISDFSKMYSGESGTRKTVADEKFGLPPKILSGPQSFFSASSSSSFPDEMSFGMTISSSLSSAIPINRSIGATVNTHAMWSSARPDKIASSFVDSKLSLLQDVSISRQVAPQEDEDDVSAASDFDTNTIADTATDDGLFEMDEAISSSNSFSKVDTSSSRFSAAGSVTDPLHMSPRHGHSLSSSLPHSRGPYSFTAALGLAESTAPKKLRWISGYCTKLGPRSANEDKLIAIPDLAPVLSTLGVSTQTDTLPVSRGYFAVYDGHCGDQASSHLQRDLHLDMCRHPSFLTDLTQAITETCIATDKAVLEMCKQQSLYCGTTALGAFIEDSKLTVFNIGDCQAVLCSSGVPVIMSSAHKPGRADETERILQARGWVTEESELYLARLHIMDLSDPEVRDKARGVTYVKINRVCGELAVSRSIGDPDYKGFVPGELVMSSFLWPDDHNQIFMGDLVIPDPEFKSVQLSSSDEFLVLASDGLWDVISEDQVVATVRQLLAVGKTTSQAAEELCDLALRMGSSDNVTIVVVQFIHVR